ncbi:MAG: hypothetical protein K2Q26_09660 [Bdellovibrionales bacterium]|nr:hypothetical protein [Bdellovibrionales bacterium]
MFKLKVQFSSTIFSIVCLSASMSFIVGCNKAEVSNHEISRSYEGQWVEKVTYDALITSRASVPWETDCAQTSLKGAQALRIDIIKVNATGRVERATQITPQSSLAYSHFGDVDGQGVFIYTTEANPANPAFFSSDIEIQKHDVRFSVSESQLTVSSDLRVKANGAEKTFEDVDQFTKVSDQEFTKLLERVRSCLRSGLIEQENQRQQPPDQQQPQQRPQASDLREA